VSRHAVDVLVEFARLVSDAGGTNETMEILAGVLEAEVGCATVAVIAVQPDGSARIAASRNLAPQASATHLDADSIGTELGEQILLADGSRSEVEITRPLVADGNLFGAVVMLFQAGKVPGSAPLRLADGLVDLTAMALAWAAQRGALERSYAELRASQETLMRNEKLRALGEMAAGVSHDLKNILSPVALHLQLAEEALAEGDCEEVRRGFVDMKHIVARGVQTIDRLKSYGRHDASGKVELTDLDDVAVEATAIAKPRMSSGQSRRIIPIRHELSGPPDVLAVSADVLSAVVNLLVNAIDALAPCPHRGEIIVRTGVEDGGSFLEVVDDGPGMPPEVQRRLFEPFFTTKGDAGTGLGLAMVYSMAHQHGGRVTLQSELGKGSTLRLWFPAAKPAPPGE
jgi:signal transduction histidine kinase